MCSWKGSIGPTSRRATATIEVPNMEKNEPRDPSLALCQICANAGDVHIYTESMDGKLTVALTCSRTTCNDFVPGNIKGGKA